MNVRAVGNHLAPEIHPDAFRRGDPSRPAGGQQPIRFVEIVRLYRIGASHTRALLHIAGQAGCPRRGALLRFRLGLRSHTTAEQDDTAQRSYEIAIHRSLLVRPSSPRMADTSGLTPFLE